MYNVLRAVDYFIKTYRCSLGMALRRMPDPNWPHTVSYFVSALKMLNVLQMSFSHCQPYQAQSNTPAESWFRWNCLQTLDHCLMPLPTRFPFLLCRSMPSILIFSELFSDVDGIIAIYAAISAIFRRLRHRNVYSYQSVHVICCFHELSCSIECCGEIGSCTHTNTCAT